MPNRKVEGTSPDALPSRQRGSDGATRLIEACFQIIADRGLAAVTHRAVAELSGTSNGLTTHHFGSIDALIRATFEHIGLVNAQEQNIYFARIRQARDLDTAIDLLARNAERIWIGQHNVGLAAVELQLAAARDERLRSVLRDQSRSYVRLLSETLKRFGSNDPDTDAGDLTALISGLLNVQLALRRQGFLERTLKPAMMRFLASRVRAAPLQARDAHIA